MEPIASVVMCAGLGLVALAGLGWFICECIKAWRERDGEDLLLTLILTGLVIMAISIIVDVVETKVEG